MNISTWLRTLLLLALSGLVAPTSWGQLTLVKDIKAGASWSYPDKFVNVNGTLYFTADDGINGRELWKSDGTDAGTMLVKNIHPGDGSSSPENLTAVGNVLYFSADDGSTGRELWKSDGTAAGTVLVKDIKDWVFNGTPESSALQNLTNVNGTLFFAADNGNTSGHELWKSDGTEAGTVLVKDINPDQGSNPGSLTAVGNTLFFVADDSFENGELWKSDGTEAGTVMVKDIGPAGYGAGPYALTAVGNTLFFWR